MQNIKQEKALIKQMEGDIEELRSELDKIITALADNQRELERYQDIANVIPQNDSPSDDDELMEGVDETVSDAV